jgi:hypothetical protein
MVIVGLHIAWLLLLKSSFPKLVLSVFAVFRKMQMKVGNGILKEIHWKLGQFKVHKMDLLGQLS